LATEVRSGNVWIITIHIFLSVEIAITGAMKAGPSRTQRVRRLVPRLCRRGRLKFRLFWAEKQDKVWGNRLARVSFLSARFGFRDARTPIEN
jgi:hypothetical protein